MKQTKIKSKTQAKNRRVERIVKDAWKRTAALSRD